MTLAPATTPAVGVDALETFVELLAQAESEPDGFYSSLCEAVCRLTSMDRAVIFRYDDAHSRVRAAGSYGIGLERFTTAHLTVESAPLARQALVEDRVIDLSEAAEQLLPAAYRDLLRDATLACTPISARGRWRGVILSDRAPRRPLDDAERQLLWTLGKLAALAQQARAATFQQAIARQLQERIDLARDVHEGVIQRLFGVQLAFATDGELSPAARERIAAELQAALLDLRRALQRPLSRSAPDPPATLAEELARLRAAHPEVVLARGADAAGVPPAAEGLAQSVLHEAVRNAYKHGSPSKVEVDLAEEDGAWVMEVVNDGVRAGGSAPRGTGMGLRLAALEALQAGGILEFGRREPGGWRVRLAVPR
jgi:signal transduction histidine kinase